MHARIALALLVFAALAKTALAADDRSVESAEALQAILDKAMPELLKGKAPDVFRKIVPDGQVDDFSRRLQSQFKPLQEKLGSPIDWMCVGVRKRGNTFREYVYVCRYDYYPVVWRMTAAEDKGRWRFMGGHFDSDYSALLAQAATDAASENSDYAQLADKVGDALAHGRGNAIDIMKANLLVSDSEKDPEKLRNSVEEVMARVVLAGGVAKFELGASKNVAGVIAERSYLVKCERSLLRLHFLMYRPGKEWKLLGFQYRVITNADEMFGNAPLEPISPAAPSKLSQTIIGSRGRDARDGRTK